MHKYVKYVLVYNVFVLFFCCCSDRTLENDLGGNYSVGAGIF